MMAALKNKHVLIGKYCFYHITKYNYKLPLKFWKRYTNSITSIIFVLGVNFANYQIYIGFNKRKI
jgi:hypothetical protein